MSRWLRLYDDTINDPKIIKLPEALRWHWIAMLCIASKNDGVLPPLDDIAIQLRVTNAKATEIIVALERAGLLDRVETGYVPHNWEGRQYKSDSSVERVKRHREKRAAAGLQSQWSAPKALRQAVYERDGFACVYCGEKDQRLSLDHRVPEIRGGTHDISNLATACLACNGAKRDMTETEYRDSVTLLKRPQRTESDNRADNSEPIGSDAAASVDHRKRLFDEGLPKLARLTGKGPDSCRAFVGKCLKVAGDDAVIVLGLIDDAERNQVADPSAWIAARLKGTGPPMTARLNATPHQQRQHDTKEILDGLKAYAAGSGTSGGTDHRLLSDHHSERS
jgi:5-methylcytosine-specific restriction endonuclease McrA